MLEVRAWLDARHHGECRQSLVRRLPGVERECPAEDDESRQHPASSEKEVAANRGENE